MPLSAEDRFAITELMARYNHAADFGDAAGFADTFTEDALFEGSASTARGREELMQVIRNSPPDRPSRHWNNNALIDGDGDDATAKVYLLRISVDGAPQLLASAVYHDTLRRVDGEWKFSHRKVHVDTPRD